MAAPLDDTLKDIRAIGSAIKISLKAIRKLPLTVEQLGATVENTLTSTDALLRDKFELSSDTQKSLGNLFERLRDIERHLQDSKVYGLRARSLRRIKEMESPPEDFCAPYRVALQNALEGLKESLVTESNGDVEQVLISDPTESPRANGGPEDFPGETLAARPAKTERKRDTVVDAIQTGLQAVSKVTDFIPGPAGPIVKLMAGTGLSIIDLLNGVTDNREAASELGSHVGILVQTVVRFLETPASGQQGTVDQETVTQLGAFLDALKSVELSLRQLESQSILKQGVSYKSNKGDLQGWDTKIKRAFDQLQNCLSLHALRSLTKMTEVDALRERDRLLDRLGDGATGLKDKVEEVVDLMCLPKTRTDVLDEVDRWLADPSGKRVLWLSGVAGCGKSAVVATIPLQHRFPSSSATFYFNRGAQERNQSVVCSLSRQLAGLGHGSLERFVLEAVKAQPNISASPRPTQFQELLVNPLKNLVPGSRPILILMDGLDEWDNHVAACKLVELVARAHSELPSSVRFVIASRNEQHLVSSMQSAHISPLVKRYELDGVSPDKVLDDIRIYINKRFSDIRRGLSDPIVSQENWPTKYQVEVLVNLSDGLFQWASTVMSYIGQRLSKDRLRGIMNAPEEFRGLDGLYRGVFKSISLDDTPPLVLQLLQNVLGFIVVAPTPVDLHTITRLCTNPSKPKTTKFIREEILARLGSFLILPKLPSDPVTVSHKSIVDFATDPSRCTDSRFYIRPIDHHQRLAGACFAVLDRELKQNICQIGDLKLKNREVQKLVERHIPSVLRYACHHWVTHLSLAGHTGDTKLSDLLDNFAASSLMHWLEVMSLCGRIEDRQAIDVLRKAWSWSSKYTSPSILNSTTQALLTDMMRFMAMFEKPIAWRAADIYACAIPLAPSEMHLQQAYFSASTKGLRSVRGPCYKPTTKSLWVGKHIPECITMSPDSIILASLTKDGSSTLLWDAATGERLDYPGVDLRRVAFSPNGKTLASGSSGPDIRIWDIETMSQTGNTLQTDCAVRSLAFSPNGQILASESEKGGVCLWDLTDLADITCISWVKLEDRTDKEEENEKEDDMANKVKFKEGEVEDDDGGDDENENDEDDEDQDQDQDQDEDEDENEDDESEQSEDEDHWDDSDNDSDMYEVDRRESFCPFIWSPDRRKLGYFSKRYGFLLWDVDQKGQINGEWDVGLSVTAFAFSSDSKILALVVYGIPSGVLLLDVEARAAIGVLSKPSHYIMTHISFSLNEKVIATRNAGEAGIVIWGLKGEAEWQAAKPLEGYGDHLCDIAFSYGTKMLAPAAVERTWKLDIEVEKGESFLQGHTSLVVCLAFSPDGRTLASGSIEGNICFWDTKLGIQTGHITSDHGGLPMNLHYTEDGSNIIATHGMRDTGGIGSSSGAPSTPNSEILERGEIGYQGWVIYGTREWFWLPIFNGEWLLRGTCLAVRTGFCVFIFDVSGVMDLIPSP